MSYLSLVMYKRLFVLITLKRMFWSFIKYVTLFIEAAEKVVLGSEAYRR